MTGNSEAKKNFLRFIIPDYNELNLSLICYTGILTFLFNFNLIQRSFRTNSYHQSFSLGHGVVWGSFALALIYGTWLSVSHLFSEKEKTNGEKNLMLFPAWWIQMIIGIYAASVSLVTKDSIAMLFAAWNLANAFSLALAIVVLWQKGKLHKLVGDKNYTPFHLILGCAVVTVILLLCNFKFGLHHATTMSICLTYAVNMSNPFGK